LGAGLLGCWVTGILGYWVLSPRGDFENCVADVEEAEDGWEEGCEFAKGYNFEE